MPRHIVADYVYTVFKAGDSEFFTSYKNAEVKEISVRVIEGKDADVYIEDNALIFELPKLPRSKWKTVETQLAAGVSDDIFIHPNNFNGNVGGQLQIMGRQSLGTRIVCTL